MSTRVAKKAKNDSKDVDSAVGLKAVVEQLLCPITSALPVCPVLAEDGRIYEREAIARWFESKSTSPLTNEKMGTRLVDSGHMRTLVITVIEGGAVDDDAAAAWHLESAKAVVHGSLPGALSSAKDHLVRADALSPSPEIKLSLEAVNLKLEQDAQVHALLKRGADAGVDLVGTILTGATIGSGDTRHRRHDAAALTGRMWEWRANAGEANNILPFQVISEEHIKVISAAAPTTTEALRDVVDRGTFPVSKMRRYGQSIVDAVVAFLRGEGLPAFVDYHPLTWD
jgi:hypothetical protein